MEFRSSFARTTLSIMAFIFTFMKTTVQSFLTNLSTRVCSCTTVNNIASLTTITARHFFLFAGLTGSCMTIFLTFMFIAIQYFLTFLTTLKSNSFLATFCHSLTFSTLTYNKHTLVLTGPTFAFMTNIRTRVSTIRPSLFVTDFSTRMGL